MRKKAFDSGKEHATLFVLIFLGPATDTAFLITDITWSFFWISPLIIHPVGIGQVA